MTILWTVGCVALCGVAQAVVPAPDGGYPGGNTAEGQNALFKLTTGGYNTAVGFLSQTSNITGQLNTAIGAGTLLVNTGNTNTATGAGALLSNGTGAQNTANGAFALFSNSDGRSNNAFGYLTLFNNQTGSHNNAFGAQALYSNQSGATNNAFGDLALSSNIDGDSNTAMGDLALANNTGGANTALGAQAGGHATTGDGNVYIGAFMQGVAGESHHTYISNINLTSVSGGGTDFVTVNLSTGLLGHLSSSRRYKEEIKPIDNASAALYNLKPVSYRYKKEIDASQSLDYGLIAEDVAKVDPNLAVRDGKGQIESVRYTAVNAMLLNEFLKEHRKVEKLEATVAEQQKQIKALAAGLEKVNAMVEMTKPAPEVASNTQ